MVTISSDSDDLARMVTLTYGRMQDGTSPYWCYVAVRPSQYKRFQEVLNAGKLDLHRFDEDGFGEVLVSGPGLYPPAEITREVARASNTPIKELFSAMDPEAVMNQKIAQLKQKLTNPSEN